MNGANILSIVAPELLFSEGNKTTIEKEYKELAKRYHPDISKNNDDGCLETYQEPKYLYDEECKWAGPIKEPI